MHIAYPIHIIDIDGTVFSYDEIEARRFAPTIRRRTFAGRLHLPLHRQHVERIVDIDGEIHTITNRYIARDDHGRIVTNADWPREPECRRESRYCKELRHAREHGLPIPGTGSYKGGPWKTRKCRLKEIRHQDDHDSQLSEILVCGRRIALKRKRSNPDWDLSRRTDTRGWKGWRRTQWK
ncbi:hypothetical protein [uncultured Salinicola sp.]|uniref:hypothetical protein n=1 Tax=uncultured Salinicola sp. TaxID=1193542 RepID=UPI00261C5776|nr:hypothetical protein [uncultured Salinicola sp.]|tara:strand:+ start:194 stop:733 length:540 start_codon:yes stop_codon:yes gene_type:complete